MARTIPETFYGTPRLSDRKVEIIREWYESSLRDSDVCTDPSDGAWYEGMAEAFKDVLDLLYTDTRTGDPDF